MKSKSKKFLSVFLAALFILCASGAAFAGTTDKSDLKFNEDGQFKIMQFSDMQDGFWLSPPTANFLKAIIEKEQPDLIVLTGDNISAGGSSMGIKFADKLLVKSAINGFMSIFEKAGVPVAAVFGNHDAEKLVTKEEQLEIYESYSVFVGYDADPNLYGCLTYNLPIYSSNGNDISFNLWMIDSNMYDRENGGYDYVHEDQIQWYVNKSNELKAANNGNAVPSFSFQHIIVNEIFDALLEVPAETPGAVNSNGKSYVLNPDNTVSGVMREAPCPGTLNKGFFSAIRAQGDITAMFFGHDHVNTFHVMHDSGIALVNSPTSGFGSYGDENRGARIITLDESDLSTFDTEVVTYLDIFEDNAKANVLYEMFANESSTWTVILSVLKYAGLMALDLVKYFLGF